MTEEEYFEYLKNCYTDEGYYEQFLITDIPRGSKILDFGCGLGLFLKMLSERTDTCELYGADINQKALDEAAKNCPAGHLVKIEGETLPFPNDYFDIIFSLDVLEHTDNPKRHLVEMRRALRPEGKIVICTPDRFAYYRQIPFMKDKSKIILQNILRCLKIKMLDPTHKKEYTILGFRRLLNKTGFQVIAPDGLERIRKYPNRPFLARLRNFQCMLKRLRPFHGYGSLIYLLEKGTGKGILS